MSDGVHLRIHLCSGCPRPAPTASLARMTSAAKKAAKAQGATAEVGRSSCLSACTSGPSALLENENGVVRLRAIADPGQLARAVAAAPVLLSAHPVPEDLHDLVLSRLLWADLDGED
ncbi:MAG: hypothetical protein FJ100_01720 [Deltaproteobacteria bacterium]|nr:hypothetical protein [Deltaproteobacteria bacterium]